MPTTRNRRKRAARDYAIAILVSGVVFGAVGFAFTPRRAEEPGDERMKHRIFTMDPEQQSLPSLWLTIMDPTDVALPSDFNQDPVYPSRTWFDREDEFVPQRSEFESVPAVIEKLTPPELPPREIFPPANYAQLLSRLNDARPPLNGPQPVPQVEPGIYWVNAEGKPIQGFPPQETKALKDMKLTAAGPTEFFVLPLTKAADGFAPLPQIRLQASSGNAQLDAVALRHLSTFLMRLSARPKTAEFQDWFQEPQTVRVLWNHVPGMEYATELRQPDQPKKSVPKPDEKLIEIPEGEKEE